MGRLNVGSFSRNVLITGATGYLGVALGRELAARGHTVRGLVRHGSERKLARGVTPVVGNALDSSSWSNAVAPSDTLVHLVGTPKPNPSKAKEFEAVDLASIRASTTAAVGNTIRHLIYVSVAHPAPVMKAYIDARSRGERLVRETRLPATILRPWYVLGPGHRWPYALIPIYAILARIRATADGARRLGLVTHRQMIAALVEAVENPPDGVRIVEVPDIRRAVLE